jgi:hypothetical protein
LLSRSLSRWQALPAAKAAAPEGGETPLTNLLRKRKSLRKCRKPPAVNKPVCAWPGVSCCCNHLKWAAFKRAANAPHSGGPAGCRMQPRQGPEQAMSMVYTAIYQDHLGIYDVWRLSYTEISWVIPG